MTLRIVILCGRAPRQLALANRLCGVAEVAAVIHETHRPWTLRRVRRMLRPRNVVRKIRWRLASGGRDPAEVRFFFGNRPAALDRPELRILVPEVNHPDVLAVVEREDPDLVVVSGCSLIRPPLLGRGRLGMINLHPGIAPTYRGVDPTFWALLCDEPEEVGCTIHRIDAGIDTGELLVHVRPEITPVDDLDTLSWKVVRDGTEACVELLARLERGEVLGRPQGERGRLYQTRERTSARERELRAKLAAGLLAGRYLPLRTTWFRAGAGRRAPVLGPARGQAARGAPTLSAPPLPASTPSSRRSSPDGPSGPSPDPFRRSGR